MGEGGIVSGKASALKAWGGNPPIGIKYQWLNNGVLRRTRQKFGHFERRVAPVGTGTPPPRPDSILFAPAESAAPIYTGKKKPVCYVRVHTLPGVDLRYDEVREFYANYRRFHIRIFRLWNRAADAPSPYWVCQIRTPDGQIGSAKEKSPESALKTASRRVRAWFDKPANCWRSLYWVYSGQFYLARPDRPGQQAPTSKPLVRNFDMSHLPH